MARIDLPDSRRVPWARHTHWLVLLAAFLAQLPLVLNPGYFGHDELQWAVFAERGAHVAWLDVGAFQYRPLTFNLWIALSKRLFDAPIAFHAVLVLWGSLNAALLCAIGRRLGLAAGPAAVGALAFALGPYAAYTHGWVATIGDLVWLSCALAAAWLALRLQRPLPIALAAAALTVVGLLGKEAAFAIPALAAVAWLVDGRHARWLAAALGSGTVALAYLGLRVAVLLDAPQASHYGVSLANVPWRWAELQLFPWLVSLFETLTVFTATRPKHLVAAAGISLALVAALWRTDRRLAAFFVVGGSAALGPVLPLGMSYNQYGYGFAAVAAMCAAAAWPTRAAWARAVILGALALNLWHGANVTRQVRQAGEVQAVFSPALAAVVRAHAGAEPLRLRPEGEAPEWLFERLTHEIPSYAGVEIGARVRIVGRADAADYSIAADGTLTRLVP